MARPTKLTPETQKKIVQAIELGASYELAANYAGVSYDAFNDWMNKGRSQQSGIYSQFYHDIKAAEGKGAVGWLEKIESAANDGNWQAAAWKLERRYPEAYGRQKLDVNHSGQIDVRSLTDEELETIARGGDI